MANSTYQPVYQLIEDCEATHKALYKFYAAVMIVIFILALPLNASVLHLFIFKLKFWKSNTNNVFLFNLVLADILLLFCLPIKAYNFIQGERRSENEVVCKAMLFMLFLNRGASISFLTVTSIDRYFNVVHPGRKNLLRALKKSPQISILIWLFLLPLTIPTMLKTFECCNSHKTTGDDTVIKVILAYWVCNLFHLLLCKYSFQYQSQKSGRLHETSAVRRNCKEFKQQMIHQEALCLLSVKTMWQYNAEQASFDVIANIRSNHSHLRNWQKAFTQSDEIKKITVLKIMK